MAMLQGPAGRMDRRNRFPRQNWSDSCSGEVQSGQNLRMSGSDAPVGPRLANPAPGLGLAPGVGVSCNDGCDRAANRAGRV